MGSSSESEVTRLLEYIQESPDMFDCLIPMVYSDLKRIAHNQRAQASSKLGPTLQTTALVHEAFFKLKADAGRPIQNSRHFRHLAAKVMRQLILDYARKQASGKRGGDAIHETLDPASHGADIHDADFVLAVERALQRLEAINARQVDMIAASFYAGYTMTEIAEMLSVSERTVRRELKKARAWLMLELPNG